MKRSIHLGGVLTAIVLASAPAAHADEGSATPPASTAESARDGDGDVVDVVTLRDGRTVRGRVTEIVPGDHVSILVSGAEERGTTRFVWGEIERVVVGAPSANRSTATSHAPATQAPAPMIGPRVRVHIVSSGKVYLHRRAAGSTDFSEACESPCDLELPTGDTYKIGGSGITTTHEFRIEGTPGQTVELEVNGPSWFGIVGGGLAAIVGGLTAYVGLLVTTASGSSDSAAGVGLGALLVGGSLIAVGLLIVFPSMKTDLSQRVVRSGKDAFVRTPTWRTIASESLLPNAQFPVLFEQRF
jgi:hypothetical protein